MPLINKVGGGGGGGSSSSKTPIKGIATNVSVSEIKINLENGFHDFKHLILYAISSVTASSSNKTIISIMISKSGNDLYLKNGESVVLTRGTLTVISYGDVSTYAIDGITLLYDDDGIRFAIGSNYAQSYNFNQNVSYAYLLLY